MITKSQLVAFLVSLTAANDADLIDNGRILPRQICDPQDRQRVREIRDSIVKLDGCWSYHASPEFIRRVHGKSQQYKQVLLRMSGDPVKQAENRERFRNALTRILSDDEVYDLLCPNEHHELNEIKAKLRGLQNPAVEAK